ncbi:MAG: NAD(P)-binding domain-containing protein [Lewinellaceae bacterium]|nr:NAD(P)-binding domain-containing protein [Lewinellaceae bacterium]
MKIAIIGHGNVGGALARRWAQAGHLCVIGARDPKSDKVINLIQGNNGVSATEVKRCVRGAGAILIATPPGAIPGIAQEIGDVSNSIIIDATNSVGSRASSSVSKSGDFDERNSYEALKALTNAKSVVKCFNTTGFENMENPDYDGVKADMFLAGGNKEAKALAEQLAKDAGFGEVYDFGGDDKVPLIESFAMAWINLAIMQKYGRGMAFKVLRR